MKPIVFTDCDNFVFIYPTLHFMHQAMTPQKKQELEFELITTETNRIQPCS